ncbi:MAG: ferrous iron transport protein A [Bacteroidia bacterium]|nr:ferrous iron transport protein A [Bacteroidia bacterium]
MKPTTLNLLQIGDKAKIIGLDDHIMSIQLMELGLLPGEDITMLGFAPFGDPMRLSLTGTDLCIRKQDAELVLVEKLKD